MSENQYECIHFKLKSADEFLKIKEYIANQKLILVDFEEMELEAAQNVIDKMIAAAYEKESRICKISSFLFMVIPDGVEISENPFGM